MFQNPSPAEIVYNCSWFLEKDWKVGEKKPEADKRHSVH